MRVLAGDIGGTKTALALIDMKPARLAIRRARTFPSAAYPGLEDIVEEFLATEGARPEAAGFGVAGPVRKGVARVTKLPWRIDQGRLARSIRIRHVALLNDFVAAALGLPYLKAGQLSTLARGSADREGPIAILGAGTGLGQAGVLRLGNRLEVAPSEGGHADFGPRNAVEDRLVVFLRRRFGRATRDRILSGSGLVLLYDFLRADGRRRESPAVREAFAKGEDRAAVVSRFGLTRREPLCRDALDLFVSIYGSEAGNLALQYRATGGVYVGGGIAPKILPALRRPAFLRSFLDKPPMTELLRRIPLKVVLDARLGLYGAAAAAYRTVIETTRLS